MSISKSFAECTKSELLEKRKKYEFGIKLIDEELVSRKKMINNKNTVNKTINNSVKKEKSSDSDESNKNKNKKKATKEDFKKVLNDKNIEYSSKLQKTDLEQLIKRHGLVKKAEEEHVKRLSENKKEKNQKTDKKTIKIKS